MDYYMILNVGKDSSIEQIKAAYKELAMKLHPDINKGNMFLADQFKIVSEAYSVLSDEEKRNEYDESIGIIRHKSYDELDIKKWYEESISMLRKKDYKQVYDDILLKTKAKYLSKIIVDAAVEYYTKHEKNNSSNKENDIDIKLLRYCAHCRQYVKPTFHGLCPQCENEVRR